MLHRGDFTTEERESYRDDLFSNTIQTTQVVVASTEALELELLQSNRANCFLILEVDADRRSHASDPEVAAALLGLWSDPAIKAAVGTFFYSQLGDTKANGLPLQPNKPGFKLMNRLVRAPFCGSAGGKLTLRRLLFDYL